jgi:hypothetical protein
MYTIMLQGKEVDTFISDIHHNFTGGLYKQKLQRKVISLCKIFCVFLILLIQLKVAIW